MEIPVSSLSWQEGYKILSGSILPRPIAFVTTMDNSGNVNAAPFSFFTAVCANPLLVCFSPMRKGTDGKKKDTLLNIEETGEFVINIVSRSMAEKMNICSADYAREVNELEMAGLEQERSASVKPPRIKRSQVQLECTLHQLLHFGDGPGSGSLVIGMVRHVQVNDDLYHNGKIDTEKLDPVGRLAGHMYTGPLADVFEIIRKSDPG
ncbi:MULTISPECIES: flavin reductase family protein [Bacillaceae]|uniref:flavin reductase family protein n=1 Tax=Bacillaceae TaxID=186817 RepID=UPI002965262C|nr:flavin reductase family protein [Bacillus infantis]MDW2878448.1 flavin reductase family protein [Bacillus infantis]